MSYRLAAITLATALTALPALAEEGADASGWTTIEPGGETSCATGTPYEFHVRPGKGEDAEKLLSSGVRVLTGIVTVETRMLDLGVLPPSAERSVELEFFSTIDSVWGSEVRLRLDEAYGILCRVGLPQASQLAHFLPMKKNST